MGSQFLEGTARKFDVQTGEKICKEKPNWKKHLVNILIAGCRDRNIIEFENYCRMPETIKHYFSSISYIDGKLISEVIRNDDGTVSQNLREITSEIPGYFWNELEVCIEHMIHEDYYIFDLTHENVLVQVIDGSYRPRLIDCKRVGRKNDPWQLNLLLPSERRKKILRKFARLKNL